MNEDFKKWVCEKANIDEKLVYGCDYRFIGVLIKAMWAINRKGKWEISIFPQAIHIGKVLFFANEDDILFKYKDHNNSEQEALEKALEYIYEKEKNAKKT